MKTEPDDNEDSKDDMPDLEAMSAEEFINSLLSEPDPVPLSSFPLQFDEWRKEFLREYLRRGEPARFEAVSHIWSTLNEPREVRCTAMGIAVGIGGTGKTALMNLLGALLDEAMSNNAIVPRAADYPSLEEWHEAVIAYFSDEEAKTSAALGKYADILGGGDGRMRKSPPQVIHGPWSDTKPRDK